MRYVPGLIAISEQADLPILRAVYRAGHLTTSQLYEFLNPVRLASGSRDSFNWRVRRLVQHGFIDRVKVAGLGNVLSLGEHGELFLQGKELTVVERISRRKGVNGRNGIWHDVDLFGIQLALRWAGVVTSWQHETEIRSTNDFTPFGYCKDYDAIVTFNVDGRSGTVALEYERTAKSSRAYERISADLNRETRIPAVLYLAPSLHMQSFLVHAFRRVNRRLYVALSDEFCSNPRRADLVDARTGVVRRLSDCLRGAD